MGNGEENAQSLVVTDDLLIRYLLGELEKAERLQVAERSFCDDDLFDRLLEAENDLVDRYVAGQLSDAERQLFETAAAERESLRQKIVFASALRSAASASGRAVSSRKTGIRTESGNRRRAWYPLAAAASLLLVVGGLWIARRGHQSLLPAQPQARDDQGLNSAPAGSASPIPSDYSQAGTGVSAPPTPAPDRAGGAGPEHNPVASVATFVLLPGSTRSAAEPKVLKVRAGVRTVRLQIQLDETESFPVYTAVLRTLHGDPVLKRSGLRPSRLPFGKALKLEVPASDLGPGQYEIELNGQAKAGSDTVVNYYYFSIAKD